MRRVSFMYLYLRFGRFIHWSLMLSLLTTTHALLYMYYTKVKCVVWLPDICFQGNFFWLDVLWLFPLIPVYSHTWAAYFSRSTFHELSMLLSVVQHMSVLLQHVLVVSMCVISIKGGTFFASSVTAVHKEGSMHDRYVRLTLCVCGGVGE